MPAVGSERQWLDPQHAGEWKLAIKMREQRIVAGRLPAERRTKAAGVDGNEQ